MTTRAEYLAFLEKRITELQSEGKSTPPKGSMETAERIARSRQNLADSKWPGVMARVQADREWAERSS